MTTEATDSRPAASPADRRLKPAVLALEDGAVDVVSFDVFDTLLWRTVPEPVDAFEMIGRRLHELGMLAPEISPRSLARLRQRAERRCRAGFVARNEIPEISLREIYSTLPPWIFGEVDVAKAVDVEVDVECDVTVVDLEVAALANLAWEYGVRLVCVSDTYFSESELRRLVDRGPLQGVEFERMFVSNHYRAGKGTGIWKSVIAALDVDPSRILHVGDNHEVDVEAPAEHGIRTVHHAQRTPQLTTILHREGVLGQSDPLEPKPWLDPNGGDFGLTALRSKTVEVAGPPVDNPFWRFGASVLGPVFTGFAEWVIEQAEAAGQHTVYCVMREGEFMSRLIDGAAIASGSSVHTKTLWLSRHVCARAALVAGSEHELRSFLARRAAPTVAKLVEGLGLEIGQFPEIASVSFARMDDPLTRERVISFLSSDERARTQVAANAAALRSRLASYVLGVTGGSSPIYLVDLGWGGTIQERLDTALAAAGPAPKTVGLYLLTNEAAMDRALDGLHARGFLAEFGLPAKVSRWVIRSPEILEQVCMCDEGSMIDIDANGSPVLGDPPSNGQQSLERVALQQGILSFQRERSRYVDQLPPPARSLSDGARAQLREIVTRFIVRPTEEEAAIFGGWLHDENFGSAGEELIVRPDIGPALAYMTPQKLLELPMTSLYWPFGAATTFNPPLALAAAAVVDGLVPDEAFAAGDPIDVNLLVDAGGWGDAGPTRITPGASGRYLLHRSVPEQHRLRHVAFRFGDDPGVLRLDWVKFVFIRRDGDPVGVHLDTPEELGQLRYRGCIELAPNIVLAPRHGPTVVYRLPMEWSEHTHAANVEIAFAWLPTGLVGGAPPTSIEAAIHLGRRAKGKARNVWLNARQEAYGRLRRS